MAETWDFYEQPPRRTVQLVPLGKQYHFVADVPVAVAEAVRPAKGADISAIAKFAAVFGTTVTGIGVRVVSASYAQGGGPKMELHVYAVQPAFVGSTNEIAFSRRVDTQGNFRVASNVWVSADGTTGVPVKASDFVEDTGLSAVLRRKCRDVSTDETAIPGLYMHQAQYIGVRALVGATNEVTDSRKTGEQNGIRWATNQWISTDGTTGVPARGDGYVEDSALDAHRRRKRVDVQVDAEAIPGLYLVTCRWENVVWRP